MLTYRLLGEFRRLFDGVRYLHRHSTHGDRVARCLFEDLYELKRSKSFVSHVAEGRSAFSPQNRRRGVKARRGDGTFGELIPHVAAAVEPGFMVPRGEIANIEIGVEVKVLAKAMLKQLARVENDLRDQVQQFQTRATNPVCVGIIGINYAEQYVSYEGDREYPTGVAGQPHPAKEAPRAEARLTAALEPKFDELLFLRYRATNIKPYPFEWVDPIGTPKDYGAALVRISEKYETRFGT